METNNEQLNNEEVDSQEVVIEDAKAVLSALERAKADAKKFREEKDVIEEALEQSKQQLSKYVGSLAKQKVATELAAKGVVNAERALKFVDMSQIDLDEDFNLIGLEDQLENLKSDLPEIFDPKFRVGGQADSAVQATVTTQYSATEMQAMKILGKIK